MLLDLWKETGALAGNPGQHRENANSTQNPGLSCYEAAALNTAPLCRPRVNLKWQNVMYVIKFKYGVQVHELSSCQIHMLKKAREFCQDSKTESEGWHYSLQSE